MSGWLAAFAFTQAVEVPVYGAALTPRPWPQRIAIAFAASLFTHPVVWWGVTEFTESGFDYTACVAAFELFAVVAEAAWMRRFGVQRSLAWALLANGASAGLGTWSRLVFGGP